jgi:hypothetical protein
MYADGMGWPVRNFARAMQLMLADSYFGLGQTTTIDGASVDRAAADLDAVGDLYCDGTIMTRTAAQDILAQMTIVRGIRIGKNLLGWTFTVDAECSGDTVHPPPLFPPDTIGKGL